VLIVLVFVGGWVGIDSLGDAEENHELLPVPDAAVVDHAIGVASASAVKVEGTACGLAVAGSGAVVDSGLVVTAAHVVAGANELRIVDGTGVHRAIAIVVDPMADVAVLSAIDLGAPPLALVAPPPHRGEVAAVLGYPGGGTLRGAPAVVLTEEVQSQLDIYGWQELRRRVLELATTVLPGTSGGPVVNRDGELLGIVFGESRDDPTIGLAVSVDDIAVAIEDARAVIGAGVDAVGTGACLDRTD
jgi:S1-C subfamily serine protease